MSGDASASNVPVQPGDVLFVQQREASQVQVQLIGEVAKPGAFSVSSSGATIMSLLMQAGGATPKAALSRAQLMRSGSVRVLNLHTLANSLDPSVGNTVLVPGDVLLIPTNTAKVAVLGEVRNPGPYEVPDGGSLSLSDAMVQAGGLTQDADKKGAQIVRTGSDGKPVSIPVNLDGLFTQRANAGNVQLAAGDVLYIPSHHHSSGTNLTSILSLAGLYRLIVP
jgi:protein involved in polysaccharide export with SLBB domain